MDKRYRVIKKLGGGAFGEIYKGKSLPCLQNDAQGVLSQARDTLTLMQSAVEYKMVKTLHFLQVHQCWLETLAESMRC